MQEINDYNGLMLIGKALSSELRLQIIELLTKNGALNLHEIARSLGVTNGALTAHIKVLEQSGIISIDNLNGVKGVQKRCSLADNKFLLSLPVAVNTADRVELEIPVGSYSRYEVHPTCGIVTSANTIGYFDEPMFFDDPRRVEAALLWFSHGYVEYVIPNYAQSLQKLVEIQISMEICSETPVHRKEWPSDISFAINGVDLGYWTSPAKYVLTRGAYTPSWWPSNHCQFGQLKMLAVNSAGTFISGVKIGSVTIDDLAVRPGKSLRYRMGVKEAAKHAGGLNLLGKGFGNYNQGIVVNMIYQISGLTP